MYFSLFKSKDICAQQLIQEKLHFTSYLHSPFISILPSLFPSPASS